MTAFMFANECETRKSFDFLNRTENTNGSQFLDVRRDVEPLNISKELGTITREFTGTVQFNNSTNYTAMLSLFYVNKNSKVKFPNRRTPYRNHFCLYTDNSGGVVIVRSETTRRHKDRDAVLYYNVVTTTEKSLGQCCVGSWFVSFDRCAHSVLKPRSFRTYTLCCAGEWWYYEKGVVLNGVIGDRSCLAYYEFYDENMLRNERAIEAQRQAAVFAASRRKRTFHTEYPEISLKPNGYGSDKLNFLITNIKIPKLATLLDSDGDVPDNVLYDADDVDDTVVVESRQTSSDAVVVNSTNAIKRKVSDDTDTAVGKLTPTDTRPEKNHFITVESVMPSAYWFNCRHVELKTGDISYFYPKQ